jgi:sugar lactone lactonase YvrE
MKMLFPSCLALCTAWVLAYGTVSAQTVSTFVSNINCDALLVDASGALYVSDYFGTSTNPQNPSGTTVHRVSPNGSISVFTSSVFAPTGLALDRSGSLYVASGTNGDVQRGQIIKFSPDGRTSSVFASGLRDLGGLVFDNSGNLYAASYGGSTIYKIAPDGKVTELFNGAPLKGSVGLAFDGNNTLYASNWDDGKIFKFSATGTQRLEQIADVLADDGQYPVSYMTYAGGALYITVGSYAPNQRAGNRIYRVLPSGQTSVYAGNGVNSSSNGAISSATFNSPNGITSSTNGDTLYVTESGTKSIRRIIGVQRTTSVQTSIDAASNVSVSPNPSATQSTISFTLQRASRVVVTLVDALGKEVVRVLNEERSAGVHSASVDTGVLATGVYVCRLQAGNDITTQKVIISR